MCVCARVLSAAAYYCIYVYVCMYVYVYMYMYHVYLSPVYIYSYCVYCIKMCHPTCNFFLEYDPRFSVAPFQFLPVNSPAARHYTPPVKGGERRAVKRERRYNFTFLTKRYNVVLSVRTTRVRVPLARNPSPLQYPTLHVENSFSVRSLLRQPRSALEAGPSEAHAISFVLTSRPRLHRKGYTFSR